MARTTSQVLFVLLVTQTAAILICIGILPFTETSWAQAASQMGSNLPTVVLQSQEFRIDWTPILVSVIGGAFTVVNAVGVIWIRQHFQDKEAREILCNAMNNSLGALQQAAEHGVQAAHPTTAIPGIPPSIAPAVQYTLDHAGEEASRLGVTPEAIADKIVAKIGLLNIQHNMAVTQNATPQIASPLQSVTVTDAPHT